MSHDSPHGSHAEQDRRASLASSTEQMSITTTTVPAGYSHISPGHPMLASMHFQQPGPALVPASPYPYTMQAVPTMNPMVYTHAHAPSQQVYDPNMQMYQHPPHGAASTAGSMSIGLQQGYSSYGMHGTSSVPLVLAIVCTLQRCCLHAGIAHGQMHHPTMGSPLR
jgi:hypothetical protein